MSVDVSVEARSATPIADLSRQGLGREYQVASRAAQGVFEGIWVYSAAEGFFSEKMATILGVVASDCKDMFVRIGIGKARHLSTKQLWVQMAMLSYRVEHGAAEASG